jgi:hypothetical protein
VPVADQGAGQLEQAEVDACVMLMPGAERLKACRQAKLMPR